MRYWHVAEPFGVTECPLSGGEADSFDPKGTLACVGVE